MPATLTLIAVLLFLAASAILVNQVIKKQLKNQKQQSVKEQTAGKTGQKIKEQKEAEIEKQSPDTLISTSNDSAAHYSRIENHKHSYHAAAVTAVSNILSRNSEPADTNPE